MNFRHLIVAFILAIPSTAIAQSTLSPRYNGVTANTGTFGSVNLSGSGSTGDVSGMSVTASGSTKTLGTWLPLFVQSSALGQAGGPAVLAPASGSPVVNQSIALYNLVGSDGSVQARIGSTVGATEYWRFMGAVTGAGPTLRAESDTATNVSGTLLAKGRGVTYWGNDYGVSFAAGNPTTSTNDYILAQGSPGGGPAALIVQTTGGDTNAGLALIPMGSGALLAHIADGTTTGGNAPGVNAVSLMTLRNAANQVAAGSYSAQVGGAYNLVSGSSTGSCTIGGFKNNIFGQYSCFISGNNGNDNGRYGYIGFAPGFFSSAGDVQDGKQVIYGRSSAGAAIRLTANGGAASATSPNANCINVTSFQKMALDIRLVGTNTTTTGHQSAYFNKALLARDNAASTTSVALGTATTLGTDTPTVSITADTTLACLNVTVTPPNTDTWDFTATVQSTEVK
jgi:hypothetical protein